MKPSPRDVRWLVDGLNDTKRRLKALENRKPGLAYSSIEDGAIREFDKEGVQGSQVGKQPDGTHGSVTLNGPKPPKPTEPIVTANPGQGEARWNGKFAGGVVSPLDLKHVAAYFVLAGEFLDLSKQAGVMTGELGDNVQAQLEPGVYSVYLVSWSLAGRYSDAAGPVTMIVPAAADTDWIQGALDDLDAKYDGVITEAGTLGDRLTQAETDLDLAGDLLADTDQRLDTVFGEVAAIPDAITAAKQAAINAAASDAQSKVDAASALANAQIEQIIAKGQSLVRNGDFEATNVAWSTGTGISWTQSRARSGAWSLQMRPATANLSSFSDWVPASPGRSFYAEFWVFEGGVPDNVGRVAVVAQVKTALGAIVTHYFGHQESSAITNYSWTKISGLVTPGTADIVAIRFGPWTESPSTSSYLVDDFLAVDVTEAQAAIQAAEAARLVAVAAQSAAGTAQSTADNALTMAGSATKAYYSTSAPSGVARTDRDIWRQINSVKDVIGEWFWDATLSTPGWVKTLISSQSISNLDVGKLTVGTGIISDLVAEHIAGRSARFIQLDVSQLVAVTGTMSEAVITKLFTDVVMSRKITTQMLAVGAFDNIIAEPDFSDGGRSWIGSGIGIAPTGSEGGGPAGRLIISSANQDVYNLPFARRIDGGSSYLFKMRVLTTVAAPVGSIWALARTRNAAGGTSFTNAQSKASVPANTWTTLAFTISIPVTSVDVDLGFSARSTISSGEMFISSVSATRMGDGEITVDGSLKAIKIDIDDLVADTGYITKLVAKIVKADMFVGKEFIGGIFTGALFQTSVLPEVGMKIDSAGLRAYGPDGGEPVSEIRTDGGTTLQVSDPSTGDVLGGTDSKGGLTGTTLAVEGEARMDGAVIMGGDPLTTGHGSGLYGATMNGRDLLGATFANYVDEHPDVADGNAWMTVIPHGVAAQHEVSTPGQVWNATGGINHTRIRAVVTLNAVSGRMYQVTYRTPAIRETTTLGGTVGGVAIVYSPPGGAISAGAAGNKALQGSRYYLRGGDGFDQAIVTTYARCPEDIPAGKIMLGPELYIYSGRAAVASDTSDTSRWSVTVLDVGMRRAAYSGKDIDSNKQGAANPTPPAPQPDPIKQYTDTVSATWWQAYLGSGGQATGNAYNGAAAQGRTPYYTPNGVMRGLIGIPSQQSRLNGATVKKIEVYVYAKAWHASSGGTACIGVHANATKPTTWSSTTNDVKRQGMKRGEGRWITLPSSVHAGFKDGTLRGISFLPPSSSTSTEYYGIFTGNKTKFRFTYTK